MTPIASPVIARPGSGAGLLRVLRRSDSLAALTALVIVGVLASFNPAILSVAQLFDLARNALSPALMALGVLLVLLAGGIDVSFTAIAAFSMYATVLVGLKTGLPMIGLIALALGIGGVLGLVNGVLIAALRVPTLIVTLGTLSLFRGALLTFLGTTYIGDLPATMDRFARARLFEIQDRNGISYSLPASFLAVVIVAGLLASALRWTIWGRRIYALGGSEVAAERIGVPLASTKIAVFAVAGALSGLAGVLHAAQARLANPFDFVGSELDVIAAVVVGGARITGGHGSVAGTLIGIFLITLIHTSLLSIGVPSYWETAVVGALIVFGAALPIAIAKRRLE